jgi:protein-L-isoaspartate O-methyltransferase/predicted transcriptional regulator
MLHDKMDLDQFQRLLWGFASHRVITVAGRTGILRMLAERDHTSDEIATELDLDELAAGKVVRALAALGIAEADGERYRAAAGLREHFLPGDHDVVPFLEHSHAMYERWGETLEPWLRGEDWPVAERTPEEVRRFGAAMRAMGAQNARRVAGILDLEGVTRMLDIGGGWGHFSQALCRVRPGLHATVLDQPGVIERARAELTGTEFEKTIDFLPGDYLGTDYGSGYDLVLFANVLHQETPDRASEMVRRGAAALAPLGRVTVVDFAIDEERREHLLGTLFAINMRSFGDTWNEPTIRGWMEEAGLDQIERLDLGPDRWVISGWKPKRKNITRWHV